MEICAIPCWSGGGEDAWFGAEDGICIKGYTEAVGVVAAVIEAETSVEGLS